MSTQATTAFDEGLAHLAGKYLTFEMGDETYGLPILNVQEIIGMMPVTRVPRTPPYVRGVINLRGRVIPVIALRQKFDMDSRQDDEKTCIIVLQITIDSYDLTIGVIVDAVSEVLNVEGSQIELTPEFGSNIDMDFILGIGKVAGRIVMLLDTNRILSSSELGVASRTAKAVGDA